MTDDEIAEIESALALSGSPITLPHATLTALLREVRQARRDRERYQQRVDAIHADEGGCP